MTEDLSTAYFNGAFIPSADTYLPHWAAEAEASRAAQAPRARLGIAYGERPRQWPDLFLPHRNQLGLLVFIHGGYWMAFCARD